MTIGDLKAWLNKLPEKFDDMNVLFREYVEVSDEQDKYNDQIGGYLNQELTYTAYDKVIISGLIDEENGELCLIDEKSRSFIISMNRRLMDKEKAKENGTPSEKIDVDPSE